MLIFTFISSLSPCCCWIETRIGEILGGGQQYASAMQVPRYVGFLRAQDLLESGAGFPNSREDAQGSISQRCAGGAKQPGQRDPVDQSERIAEEEAGSAEAEETSRWIGREWAQEEASGSRQAAVLLPKIAKLLRERSKRGHPWNSGA